VPDHRAKPEPVVAWELLTRPIRAGDSVTVEDGKLLVIRNPSRKDPL